MVKSPPLTLLDSSCITGAVHALDNLFATLAKNCAKSGIIETEEPPELLSHIATDLIIHELYVRCSQNANFSLRERARQYAEVKKPLFHQYCRMGAEPSSSLFSTERISTSYEQ